MKLVIVLLVGGLVGGQFIFRLPSGATNPLVAARLPDGDTSLPNPAFSAAGASHIDDSRSQCGSAVDAYTGTAATINTAIQNCTAGGVVVLNAGTFTLSTGITFNNKSNVTLRGAGADQTLLVFSGTAGCHGFGSSICMDGADTNWQEGESNTATWSAGYTKGTTTVTLSSKTSLTVGDPIILDQADDGTTEPSDLLWYCENYNATTSLNCSEDGVGGGGSGGQRPDRGQMQIVTVTSIEAGTCAPSCDIGITPGLYAPNWRSGQSPGAWWASTPGFNMGVEDLSINGVSSTPYSNINLANCSGCWVKGVRSIQPDRNHVLIWLSPHATVRDSYFFGILDAQSQSYGVEVYGSSDSLIENNIIQQVTAPLMINGPCAGCVLGYNFSLDDRYVNSTTFMMHQVHLHSNVDFLLIEGNDGAGMYGDLFHGSSHMITAFRNRYSGFQPNHGTTTTDWTIPFPIIEKHRYFNLIGNVLGDTGRPHNCYEKYAGNAAGSLDQCIYVLGAGGDDTADDTQVRNTLYRWGNWDVVTSTDETNTNDTTGIKWDSSEVPSGLSNYAQSVPADHTLPNSLYRSAKPAFFGSITWPPIGPDVASGNISNTGGHANKIPARVCYESVMSGPANGTGSVLTFNRASCY